MKLWLVFLLGFATSVVIVGGVIWFFAAYETKDLNPFFHSPRMSQDKWFEVIRNAVTTGAALGVGVTLFFSYRRQQTAEETQRIGAEAQLTAAKAQQTAAAALELANRQHGLDQGRRKDAITAELRFRYVQTAEQLGSEHLAIRLAGIYSLAALADDWAEAGNEDERQVCIDLLCAYFRSAQSFPAGDKAEAVATTFDVVMARLRKDASERKCWGGSSIALVNPGEIPNIDGLVLYKGGSFRIVGATSDLPVNRISGIELNGGSFALGDIKTLKGILDFSNSRLNKGLMRLSFQKEVVNEAERPGSILFRRTTLAGSTLIVNAPGREVRFVECVFKSGELYISTGNGPVVFRDCRFEGDVFQRAGWMGSHRPVSTTILSVEDCYFEPGLQTLESYRDEPVDSVPPF